MLDSRILRVKKAFPDDVHCCCARIAWRHSLLPLGAPGSRSAMAVAMEQRACLVLCPRRCRGPCDTFSVARTGQHRRWTDRRLVRVHLVGRDVLAVPVSYTHL